jgi:hypothetical protein
MSAASLARVDLVKRGEYLLGPSDAPRLHPSAITASSFGLQLYEDTPDPGRLKASRQKRPPHIRPYGEVVRQDLIGAPQNVVHATIINMQPPRLNHMGYFKSGIFERHHSVRKQADIR